jgi:hypothetical protein
MATTAAPYYPILYVRGYAMTRGEIDDTTADPFCGFNIGSTTYRATPDRTKPAKKFVFESPVVRLGSDFGYEDVYRDGLDVVDPEWTDSIPVKSIVIYRYYDQASNLLGSGKTPDIKTFARGLSDLILRVRDLVCQDPANGMQKKDFRCYLVAHSMGGLVCRAFLQNPKLGKPEARGCVDKVFTYATPHNGVDMAGMNAPSWLTLDDLDNFNRKNMADYLSLKDIFAKTGRVDWLPEDLFPSRKFFCMIGTNRADYEVAKGLSRTFAGHGSDGLVRIENASVWGVDANGKESDPSATAYAYRSHSGYFGIVNSEESYQNLIRFLFGDLRVDIWLDVESVKLPPEVQAEADKGRAVDGLYQFEILASPRGKRWQLTRRMAEEDSPACRAYADLTTPAKKARRSLYLSSVFLGNQWKVNANQPTLAYSLSLGVRVPDYEVDRSFWPDKHYEGTYLFHDSVVIEMTPPKSDKDSWQVAYTWQEGSVTPPSGQVTPEEIGEDQSQVTLPFGNGAAPGIKGTLRFVASAWNE